MFCVVQQARRFGCLTCLHRCKTLLVAFEKKKQFCASDMLSIARELCCRIHQALIINITETVACVLDASNLSRLCVLLLLAKCSTEASATMQTSTLPIKHSSNRTPQQSGSRAIGQFGNQADQQTIGWVGACGSRWEDSALYERNVIFVIMICSWNGVSSD